MIYISISYIKMNILEITDLCLQLIYSLDKSNWTVYNILIRLNKRYNSVFKKIEEIFIDNIVIFRPELLRCQTEIVSKYDYILPNNKYHGISYTIYEHNMYKLIHVVKYEKGKKIWENKISKNQNFATCILTSRNVDNFWISNIYKKMIKTNLYYQYKHVMF